MPTPTRPAPTSRGAPADHHVAAWDDSVRQREALLDDALDTPLPPPIERGRGRAIVLFGAGLIMAAVLVIVVLNVDRGLNNDRRESQASGTLDPAASPPDLGVDNAAALGDMQHDLQQFQTERGWIQATENGRLAQEYRYARSEPAAGGRLHMTAPEVKVYLDDNRVLSLRGKSADVAAPSKALESGTMNGDVLIRLYELSSMRQLDEAADVPVLEVRTQQASFDNFQGEVLCPGDVDIQTRTAHLPARGLRMHINDVEGRPGQITIERINGELRLSEQVRADGTRNTTRPARADTMPETAAESPRVLAARPRRERGEPHESAGQRPRARRNRMTPPEPIQASAGPYFYRLTLSLNVRIRQGDGSRGWTATGDQMHMIFSLDSDDLGDSLSSRSESRDLPRMAVVEPISPNEIFASLMLAATQDSLVVGGLFKPSDTDTIITCDGPLAMVPLLNAAEQPESVEDSRFELLGSPVMLHNNEDATNITCATLQYASLSEVLELIGSTRHRLSIDSPDLHAEASRFWVDRLKNIGGFGGAGWMAAGEEASTATAATQPTQTLAQSSDVRIAWNTGVDLVFRGGEPEPSATGDEANPHDSFGRLQQATFKGEVDVASPDFTLDAQTMVVGFPERMRDDESGETKPGQRLASLEFIHATTNVVAGSLSDGGSITCEDLRVNFTSHQGKTVPVTMLARQNVAAVDQDRQTVWADALDVTFKPSAAAGNPEPAASQPDEQSRRRADVDRFTADGSVQILMADGARVFADHLEADGEGHMVVLTGEDVMVVSDRSVLRRGRRLELTDRGERVTWPGSGEFAYFTTPVLSNAQPQRVMRPVVDESANPRQMLATWSASLLYDGLAESGAGAIDVYGDVNAQSTPTALELNSMTGDSLKLVFTQAIASEADQPATSMPATAPATTQSQAGLFAMDQRGRRLKKLIATGNARLESRTWQNPDRSDKPRVFWLAGQQVNYDDQTLEAFVPGGGELLVRDERFEVPATQAATPPDAGQTAPKADLPFGARGTTHFRWTEHLRMTHRSGNLYDIELLGGIEVRHRALDQSLATMTGNRLEAVVDRAQGDTQRDAGLDLGGSMDLRRIHALGNVYVDSPTRDVDCDEFDFDYATGIAQLKSAPGRMVTVVTAGNPHPVQARSFSWNTVNDTVQAMGISGSSGR